jgi:glycosyltransferase involved in cell wall biosynthesis
VSRVPWIVDFRDPMTEIDPVSQTRFPADPRLYRARAWIERLAVTCSIRTVLVTRGALRIYQARYPELPVDRWALIPNGYDEDVFSSVEKNEVGLGLNKGRVTLLHSGVLYPTPDRDPRHFFRAIARLKKEGDLSAATFRVILRASGSEGLYHESILSLGIDDLVALEPAIPYREALAEMMKVEGLLLFQGKDSNPAVPAKLYEYIRVRRPVLALVDAEGDTAAILRETGIGLIAPLDSEEAIISALRTFLAQVRNGTAPLADESRIECHSREWGAGMLASLLDDVVRRK